MKVEKSEQKIDRCRFGADYYPEHWPRDRWETDARLMRELGLQVVRMGEFSWSKFEPKQGDFQFDWLDDAIMLLGGYGISTIIGTPTAAPPAWVIEQHPDILPVDSQGQQKGFGGRHHDCQSNAHYRGHIRRLVTAMAEHYKSNPNVIGWQIDNELGNSHDDLCMCESCQSAFQAWLKRKYGSLDMLNEAWGTAFWSQTYDSFGQIPAPRQTPTMHNPSLLLDWRRFCSDLVVDFQHEQVEIIRRVCPQQQITHNLMGLYDKTDYFTLAADLDFASNDQYPTGYYFDPPGQPPYEISACLDFIRDVKKKNFWMMELEAGPTGGPLIGRMPRPGQLRLWTGHCVAHGADTIVYFRWRTCLFGTEQFWHGILPHNGVPGRRYEEIKATIDELSPVMDDIHGLVSKADVAILFSYDQNSAFRIQPHHPDLNYIGQVKDYYNAFYSQNIPVDFIGEQGDFSAYKLIVAPLQYLMTPGMEARFAAYVQGGGRVVLTMRTGVKNENNVCMDALPLPGKLAEVLGLTVPEYDCLLGQNALLRWQDGSTGTATKWCDLLTLHTARPLAEYASQYYSGVPAISVNAYGQGKAYYVGTEPDAETLARLAALLAEDVGMTAWGETPDGVELTVRPGKNRDYLFAMNHTEWEQPLQTPQGWQPLQNEERVLPPFGMRLYTRDLPERGL